MENFVRNPSPEKEEERKKIPILYKKSNEEKERENFLILTSCQMRNPGYICTYSNYSDIDDSSIVAYRPSEICDYDNYDYYLKSNFLKNDFFEYKRRPLYLSIFVSLLSVLIFMIIFYKLINSIKMSLMFSILSGVLIGVLLYYFLSKQGFNKMLNQIKDKKYSKKNCYSQIFEYNTILGVKKKDHGDNIVDPETLLVKKYVKPNDIDIGILLANDKWKYDVNDPDSIELFKKIFNIEKFKFMNY